MCSDVLASRRSNSLRLISRARSAENQHLHRVSVDRSACRMEEPAPHGTQTAEDGRREPVLEQALEVHPQRWVLRHVIPPLGGVTEGVDRPRPLPSVSP